MFSFQEIGIEGFYCIHGGVLISGDWNEGVLLYTWGCQEIGIEGFYCINRGVLILGGYNILMCPG